MPSLLRQGLEIARFSLAGIRLTFPHLSLSALQLAPARAIIPRGQLSGIYAIRRGLA